MKKQHIKLPETDERYLTTLLSKGQLPARVFRRASALLQLHGGASFTKVAQTFQIRAQSVSHWRNRYLQTGLDFLDDQPRSGRPVEFDGVERAKLTALACSTVSCADSPAVSVTAWTPSVPACLMCCEASMAGSLRCSTIS